MMHPFATSLLEVFEQYADPKRAAEMSAYMKEIDASDERERKVHSWVAR